MNKLMLDAQTLQMQNQQELSGLLQSRLERVSFVMGRLYGCTMLCCIPRLMQNLWLWDTSLKDSIPLKLPKT